MTENGETHIKALYESVGRGFESLPSHQKCREIERFHGFFVFAAEVAHTCTLSAHFTKKP